MLFVLSPLNFNISVHSSIILGVYPRHYYNLRFVSVFTLRFVYFFEAGGIIVARNLPFSICFGQFLLQLYGQIKIMKRSNTSFVVVLPLSTYVTVQFVNLWRQQHLRLAKIRVAEDVGKPQVVSVYNLHTNILVCT